MRSSVSIIKILELLNVRNKLTIKVNLSNMLKFLKHSIQIFIFTFQ